MLVNADLVTTLYPVVLTQNEILVSQVEKYFWRFLAWLSIIFIDIKTEYM